MYSSDATHRLPAPLNTQLRHRPSPAAACRDAKAQRRTTSMLNRMDTLNAATDKFDGRQSMARLKARAVVVQWATRV